MSAHTTNATVEPFEGIDFLRDLLESEWDQYTPKGLVAYFDGDGDDADGGGDGDDGDAGDGDDGDDGDGDSGDGDDDGDGDDGDGDRVSRAELDAAQRRIAKAEKDKRRAEKKLRDKEQADREEAGEYKDMYEESQKEVARLNGVIRDGAFEREVANVATKLRYKNPGMAKNLVGKDLRDSAVDEDGEVDTALIERELKKLARDEDYLVNPEPKKQRQVNGDRTTTRDNGDNGDDDDNYTFDPGGKMKTGLTVGSESGGGD